MKKGIIAVIIIAIIVLIAGGALISTYNGLVSSQAGVEGAFANIDTQLQRRADLIPNLVNTVKGYMEHEQQVMQDVADARAKLAGASTVEDKNAANNELTGALSRLLMVAENYPDLKANAQFTALTDELAGTENRISVARKDYNDVVKEYNTAIRKFPKNIFASMFGFEEAAYFEADESAQDAPKVEF